MAHTIILIRHAESELNRDRHLVGGQSAWCELNALGVLQSRCLGRRLAPIEDLPQWRICCSTAVRAQQTMRYSLASAGVSLSGVELHPELIEVSQGQWEGQPRAQVITPQIAQTLREQGWTFRPPGGESCADVAARVLGWIQRQVLDRAHPAPVAIFTHGVVIRAVWIAALGLEPLPALFDLPVENTSMSVLRHDGQRWWPQAFNDVDHLRAEGVQSLAGYLRPAKLAYPSASSPQADALDA